MKGDQELAFEVEEGVLYRVYRHPQINRGRPEKQVVVHKFTQTSHGVGTTLRCWVGTREQRRLSTEF